MSEHPNPFIEVNLMIRNKIAVSLDTLGEVV